MPRGNMPRQPSRSGRQEGARRSNGAHLKGTAAKNAAARAGKVTKIAVLKKKPASRTGYAASRISTGTYAAARSILRASTPSSTVHSALAALSAATSAFSAVSGLA